MFYIDFGLSKTRWNFLRVAMMVPNFYYAKKNHVKYPIDL